MKSYKTEARSRWGATDAYREHEQKTKNYTKEKWAEANDGLMAIFVLCHSLKTLVLNSRNAMSDTRPSLHPNT